MEESKLLSLFPYDYPYNEQVEYMKDVKSILEEGGIAILEAPTGFGKTAALLATTPVSYTHLTLPTICSV